MSSVLRQNDQSRSAANVKIEGAAGEKHERAKAVKKTERRCVEDGGVGA